MERAVISAIKAGIAVYSSHTALDSASHGVSRKLGVMLGLESMRVLAPQPGSTDTGLGIVGEYPSPMSVDGFIARVKEVYGAPVVRRSEGPAGLKRNQASSSLQRFGRRVHRRCDCCGS